MTRIQGLLTASSMVARHPCIDENPYRSLPFSPSSDTFSVLGVLRYIPIPTGTIPTIPSITNPSHSDPTTIRLNDSIINLYTQINVRKAYRCIHTHICMHTHKCVHKHFASKGVLGCPFLSLNSVFSLDRILGHEMIKIRLNKRGKL